MKPVTLVCAILAVAATCAVTWQRKSLADICHSDQTNSFTPTVRNTNTADEQEFAALREQTKDLPRLRNEVTQLRARKAELDAARREREQLLAARRTGANVPRQVPAGFTSKEQLINAGFATPEDVVQTFFWAIREGDLRMMTQALLPASAERQEMENLPPDKRAEIENSFRTSEAPTLMKNFSDFVVRDKEIISDAEVVLHLGSSLTTNTMKVQIDRFGGEWRLDDVPR